MKRIALLVPFCFCTFLVASAQDSLQVRHDPDSYKARQGSVATELNVNPFKGELSLNNAVNQIKFRYFASDGIALRLAFTANTLKDHVDRSVPYGTDPYKFEQTRKSTTLGAAIGVEKHFNGSKRLSPYIGAEVAFTNKSSSEDISTNSSSTKIKGAWQTVYSSPGSPSSFDYTEKAFTRMGANAIMGFDFYLARHLYMGYEFTFGFASTRYKDVDITTIYTGSSNPGNSNNTKSNENSFSAGPSLVNGIRIGYVF